MRPEIGQDGKGFFRFDIPVNLTDESPLWNISFVNNLEVIPSCKLAHDRPHLRPVEIEIPIFPGQRLIRIDFLYLEGGGVPAARHLLAGLYDDRGASFGDPDPALH